MASVRQFVYFLSNIAPFVAALFIIAQGPLLNTAYVRSRHSHSHSAYALVGKFHFKDLGNHLK